MKNKTVNVSTGVQAQLNPYQIEFIERAYQRIFFIEDQLDYDHTPPYIRLLYLKELFTIFEELHKIKFKRSHDGQVDPEHTQKLDELKLVVTFIRNVLSHFPLFNTWDEIEISQEFSIAMGGNKNGKIYKFLKHDERRTPTAFRLTYVDGTVRQAAFHYPQNISPDQRVFLKDIISEQDGALIVLSIMSHIF